MGGRANDSKGRDQMSQSSGGRDGATARRLEVQRFINTLWLVVPIALLVAPLTVYFFFSSGSEEEVAMEGYYGMVVLFGMTA